MFNNKDHRRSKIKYKETAIFNENKIIREMLKFFWAKNYKVYTVLAKNNYERVKNRLVLELGAKWIQNVVRDLKRNILQPKNPEFRGVITHVEKS